MPAFPHRGNEKRLFVRRMFADVTRRYDFLNHLFTGGLDILWRKRLVKCLHLGPHARVLDLACGTGDVAREILRESPEPQLLVGADPVPAMLVRAKRKVSVLRLVVCESERLPFRENSFTAVTIAFGVRNFHDLETGLAQVHRILEPGGKLGILEFAVPENLIFRHLYQGYLTVLLPLIGRLVSRGYAYRYLPESIRYFPAPADFAALLESAGFTDLESDAILRGGVRLYRALKEPHNKTEIH
jgi:demethylmenaquinone methyltransferase/2-methoxy-6-polyprenyl-1,4-benzoquinol methylase